MNASQYLRGLGHALPLSTIKNPDGSFRPMSNSDIRRLCEQKAVLLNGEPCTPTEEIDFPVFSLVLYPNGKRRTTLV